jgi:transcriptional regulator with XRE-family HTH domain
MTVTVDAQTAEERLGHHLRRLREDRGWSQEKVAKQMTSLGHPWRQTTVFKTENAARPIRVNDVAALAQVFGIPAAALLNPAVDATTDARMHAATRAIAELEQARNKFLVQVNSQIRALELESIEADVEQAQARCLAQQED